MLWDVLIASLKPLLIWETYAAIAVYLLILYLPLRAVFANRRADARPLGFKLEAAHAALQGAALGLLSSYLCSLIVFRMDGADSVSFLWGWITHAPGLTAEFVVSLSALAATLAVAPYARALRPTRAFCISMLAIAMLLNWDTAERIVNFVALALLLIALAMIFTAVFRTRRLPSMHIFCLAIVAIFLLIHKQKGVWFVCINTNPTELYQFPGLAISIVLVGLVAATEAVNFKMLKRVTLTDPNNNREFARHRKSLVISVLGLVPLLFYLSWLSLKISGAI